MQNNDWDTDNPVEIAAAIAGQATFEPFLAKGAGLIPAGIVCMVWNFDTKEAISNASVQLQPGTFRPVTENSGGIYSMACLGAGNYTVTVSAPGYANVSRNVDAVAGTLKTLVFGMSTVPVPPANGGGCFGGTLSDMPWPVNPSLDAKNLLPCLAMLLCLASASRMAKRGRASLRRGD